MLGKQPFCCSWRICCCSCSNESIVASKVNLQSMRCSGSSAVSMVLVVVVVVSASFIFAGGGAAPAWAQITPSTSIGRISVGDIWRWNCNCGTVGTLGCETLSLDCTWDSSDPPLSLTAALVVATTCIYTKNRRAPGSANVSSDAGSELINSASSMRYRYAINARTAIIITKHNNKKRRRGRTQQVSGQRVLQRMPQQCVCVCVSVSICICCKNCQLCVLLYLLILIL